MVDLFYYFGLLFLFVTTFILLASLIQLPKVSDFFYFDLILRLIIVVTFFLSTFAVVYTKGISIFILYFIILFYLIKSSFIKFHFSINFSGLFKSSTLLVYLLPIYFIQVFLHFSFKENTFYVISDDIYDYASTSYQLVHYGYENRNSILANFYPDLFKGIQPYHYYELWLNGIFTKFTYGSYVYTLLFVTYPFLIWLLVLVFLSFIEYFQIKKYKNLFVLLFFTVGPVYFSVYLSYFNDGNFFNSAVFPIIGFVKQTLPYAYFGQKHLPVYILSGLLLLGILKNNLRVIFFAFTTLIISSVGVFPGLFSAFFIFSVYCYFKKRKVFNFLVPIYLFVFIYLGVIHFFGFEVSKEMSAKTSYLPHFLKHLNWKGEILRVLEKLFFPAVWFLILYLPYLLVLWFTKNKLNNTFLPLKWFVVFSYVGGVSITVFLYGINSDQFITNMLPIYNLIFILFLIATYVHLNFTSRIKKRLVMFCGVAALGLVNCNQVSTFHFQSGFKGVNSNRYAPSAQKELLVSLQKHPTKYIAYLLSDSILKTTPPVIQYPYLPAKFCMERNYFNFVDINFPFYNYRYNTSSDVFSPKNQLKYFIKKNITKQNMQFESYQLAFLKKFNFKWIFCAKNAFIPTYLLPFIKQKIVDPKSGEHYYRIELR